MKTRMSYAHLAFTLPLVSICLYSWLRVISRMRNPVAPPPTNGQLFQKIMRRC
jgi:hypothetical protein